MTNGHNADSGASASHWMVKALIRVTEREKRGGGYLAFARIEREILGEHRPTGDTGSPCTECAESWPCGMFMSIFAPD